MSANARDSLLPQDIDASRIAASHTFVVPAYKENPFLKDCLRSLQAQSLRSNILITTSTPCAHIARAASDFGVALKVNPRRQSIGSDWNFALAAAPTRYVTLAHQDDVYAPAFVARTSAVLSRRPEATLLFTGCQQIDDSGRPRISKISIVKELLLATFAGRRECVAGRRGRLLLSFGNPISCSSVTFDRDRLGDFRFCEEMASNLDWLAWVSLLEAGHHFAYCRERLISRRYNGQTETSRLIIDGRRRAEDKIMFDRLWPSPVARIIAKAYASGY